MESPKEPEEQADEINIPDEIYIRSEYKRSIKEEIDRLPEQCGRVFKLACYDGLKNKEISSLLRISEKTVNNHKVRAMQLLRIGQHRLAGIVISLLILYLLSF